MLPNQAQKLRGIFSAKAFSGLEERYEGSNENGLPRLFAHRIPIRGRRPERVGRSLSAEPDKAPDRLLPHQLRQQPQTGRSVIPPVGWR